MINDDKQEEYVEHKINYKKLNEEHLDDSEILIYELNKTIINIYKLCYENMGYDLGSQFVNEIHYVNYLENNPINFSDDYYFNTDDMKNDFGDLNLGLAPGDVSNIGVSEGMIGFISVLETGSKFGYQMKNTDIYGKDLGDAKGHRTFGYGLLVNPITKVYMDTIKSCWSQEELEKLFKYTIKQKADYIDKWAAKNNVTLNQNQKDALVSACYNFGEGFMKWDIAKMIKVNPNDKNIFERWSHFSDKQGRKYPGLIKRRKAEANWYFGTYS